jgi:hypothetical protein
MRRQSVEHDGRRSTMARRLLFAVLMLGLVTTLAHAEAYVGASVGQGAVNDDFRF